MAERLIVLVENDPVLSERVRAVLSAHSFRVDVIADGNELLTGPQLRPVLIILCIDPKRLGWAICNKVKKTVQYRDVPLIVTSQEATDKDYEEHKKLRTRAEEYLNKPFSVELLLSKIDQLVGLRQASSNGDGEVSLDDASIEELSVDEAVIEEELTSTTVGSVAPRRAVDQEIEDETESAFAAIGVSKVPPASVAAPARSPLNWPPESRPNPVPSPVRGISETSRPTTIGTVTQPAVSRPGPDRTSPRVELPRPTSSGGDISQTVLLPRSSSGDPNATLKIGSRLAEQPSRASEAADLLALEQALAEANKRAEKAESQAAFWHDQRDLLASERDQLTAERERQSGDRGELTSQVARTTQQLDQALSDRRQLLAERDQLVAERNQLAIERNQLASDRDSRERAPAPGPSPELLVAQARLSSERDTLLSERVGLHSERDRLLSERQELLARLERLSSERDELLSGHDRLATDVTQLQARLVQVEQSATAATPPPVTTIAPTAAELAELTELRQERQQAQQQQESELARFHEAASGWQAERSRLLAELDEAKQRAAAPPVAAVAAPPTSGMARDRELITLKEIINKKEKESLDLRDAMDSKDRQVLDARDRARDMERQKRELDEKLLAFEREHLTVQEKLETVSQDKEVWQEREKGLKGRLEDAQRKLGRLDEEFQALRRRLDSEAARSEALVVEEKRRSEDALQAVRQQQAESLQQLAAERDAREAELIASHQQAVQRERAAADEDKRSIEQRHGQAWAQFEAQYQSRFEDRVRLHEETLAEAQRVHAAQLQDRDGQQQRMLAEVASQLEHARIALSDAKAQHEHATELLREQLTSELSSRHAEAESRAVREAESRLRSITDSEKEVLRSERATYEKRASELASQLGEVQQRLHSVETSLTALRSRSEESEATVQRLREQLGDREQQLGNLRGENAALQEQIQRAYQRLVSDENQLVRVRRALSIAVGILDEPPPADATAASRTDD